MRELTYYVAVSLDGFIAAADGDFGMFPVEGDHIEMILRDWTDTVPAAGLEAVGLTATGARLDTTLMGWNTYAAGFAWTRDPYPHTRQIVFSRRHAQEEVPANVTVTDEDPVAVVRRLKQEEGTGIWLCGGGVLAAQLAAEIDRLVLKVNPFVLGSGVPLFGDTAPRRPFRLEASTAYESGVVVNEYAA